MENTGLSNLLKSEFGGVEKMLSGKNVSHNTRALFICVEEVLRSILILIVLWFWWTQQKQDCPFVVESTYLASYFDIEICQS